MSVQWRLTLAGGSAAEIASWVCEQPGASPGESRPGAASAWLGGRAVLADIYDLEPHQVDSRREQMQIQGRCEVLANIQRGVTDMSGHLALYRLAFAALKRWPDDMVFEKNGGGIFARRGGRLIVNPEYFVHAKEINALLEPPFWLADEPCDRLLRAGLVSAGSGSAAP